MIVQIPPGTASLPQECLTVAENSKEPDRLSLHGMTPEHALRKALGTPPQKRDDAAIDRLAKAFSQFSETGESTATCDGCGYKIEFERVADHIHESRCWCGNFNDTLRGL